MNIGSEFTMSDTKDFVGFSNSNVNQIKGPLRVSDINPRYFTDNSGKAVYLTGSHTWNNLVDMGPTDPPEALDFSRYLSWMKSYNHNFIRLWAWELLRWDTGKNKNVPPYNHYIDIHPFARTGPGTALDGKPKFDLTKLNEEYFKRLHNRVSMASDSDIYIAVMLFEGWGNQFLGNAYQISPFNPANNINNITGDLNGDGKALEVHQLAIPEITAIQKEYIKKVIDSVNEFDNVLYEIGNEIHNSSTEWQFDMIRFVKEYETQLPKQHPVGMTYQHKLGVNQTLFDSPADWISPNDGDGYRENPPVADGSKVIITDTDHLWGIGGSTQWVWKSFLRGLNPIFMDSYESKVLTLSFDLSWAEPLRVNMGYTLNFADRIDLIHMTPQSDLATSTYCLANRGNEYLVFLPNSNSVSVDLTDDSGSYSVEWFNPENGEQVMGNSVNGGSIVNFTVPFSSTDAVLYLKIGPPTDVK